MAEIAEFCPEISFSFLEANVQFCLQMSFIFGLQPTKLIIYGSFDEIDS